MKHLFLPLILFSGACSETTGASTPTPKEPSSAMTKCLAHSPNDVAMWINAMPGANDNPTLIAMFKVTAPTPGYRFDFKILEVKESEPPQYVFDLVSFPPTGIVTEVETETDVRIEIPGFDHAKIAAATVMCDGKVLFELDEVETAY